MKIHISYKSSEQHDRTNLVFDLWCTTSGTEKIHHSHIFTEWEKGTIDLLIPREDFFKLIKDIISSLDNLPDL